MLDVGTGSGCLAVTLALELAGSVVVASDLSPGALEVAASNARDHRVEERLHVVASDLATPLDVARFDLVVSNPPYVDPAERPNLSPEVSRFEPAHALFADQRGGALLERIAHEIEPRAGTPLLLEIGHDQADRIGHLARTHGWQLREVRSDLAGRPRIAILIAR